MIVCQQSEKMKKSFSLNNLGVIIVLFFRIYM